MKIRFDPRALAAAVLLFVVLAVLATAGARWGWVRSFLGDTLAVIWVYYVFKTALRAPAPLLAGLAFGVGAAVELGQYIVARMGWRIPNPVLRIVLGSTADWWDVAAYALGGIAVLAIELPLQRRRAALARPGT
ncbi:hypothetical protein CAL29_21675 [Bordetella genomosp. 10]|uniref:DUF2809 domain-containing protein n=1 Tax=Bordetella genomosp. 10 TaxID=1416804 RepID=A0A261RZV1_9BORD|nr:DUF2809 domain-containing protein [Bordetella genomosp. 10]OZI30614.1 hypothetical protein CAL29_21675 [Bordetella genomosp. 10]